MRSREIKRDRVGERQRLNERAERNCSRKTVRHIKTEDERHRNKRKTETGTAENKRWRVRKEMANIYILDK